jgi:hypothetical protein
MNWILPAIAAGVGIVAGAFRAYRRKLEEDEDHRTRQAKAAAKARIQLARTLEQTKRRRAQRQGSRNKATLEATYVQTARAIIARRVNQMQTRALARMRKIETFLRQADGLRGEKAAAWIEGRKAKRIPRDDIRALADAFREFEVQLGRREYEHSRLREFVVVCGQYLRRLDEARGGAALDRLALQIPDEAGFSEVPVSLPARYGLCFGRWVGATKGGYFTLPFGFRGELASVELPGLHLRAGSERELYVNYVDYRTRLCRVSIEKVQLLRALESTPQAHFDGRVERMEPAGARVLVHGVRCFLPRSRLETDPRPGDLLKVRFAEFDKYLKSPLVTPVGSTVRAGLASSSITSPGTALATTALDG